MMTASPASTAHRIDGSTSEGGEARAPLALLASRQDDTVAWGRKWLERFGFRVSVAGSLDGRGAQLERIRPTSSWSTGRCAAPMPRPRGRRSASCRVAPRSPSSPSARTTRGSAEGRQRGQHRRRLAAHRVAGPEPSGRPPGGRVPHLARAAGDAVRARGPADARPVRASTRSRWTRSRDCPSARRSSRSWRARWPAAATASPWPCCSSTSTGSRS